MPVDPVLLRGNVEVSDRVTDIHPDHWDPEVFDQLPVKAYPLTAKLTTVAVEPDDSVHTHWWEKGYTKMAGDVTDVYTDATLESGAAYASGGVAGTPLYISMSASDAKQIVPEDTLIILDADGNQRRAQVTDVQISTDANTYVAVSLSETDTSNKLAGASLTFLVGASSHPEGSALPDSKAEEPTEFDNYKQIFMEAVEATGTELAEGTRLSEDFRTRLRKDGLDRFMKKLEWTLLMGVRRSPSIGSNGKRQYWTEGLISAITRLEPTNVFDYKNDTTEPTGLSIAGKQWQAGGMNFIDGIIEYLSRWSTADSLDVYAGSIAWLRINQLIRDFGDYTITAGTDSFGVNIKRIDGMPLTLNMYLHPMFTTTSDQLRKSALIVDTSHVRYNPMTGRDLMFIGDEQIKENGHTWVDGIKEGWVAQAGLKYRNLAGMAWVKNIGDTNVN